MKRILALCVMVSLLTPSIALAGLGGEKAAYQGGTMKDINFPGAQKAVEGELITGDDKELKFVYELNDSIRTYPIAYSQFLDIEYGQKAGRRVGAAVATAILISPVGLFMLFSKKRKHFVTIGYKDDAGKEQVAVFELGKDLIRTVLPILEARSGKKIVYQDEEAKKAGK